MSSNHNYIQDQVKTVVVIDSSVDNYETLLQGVDPNAEVIILDPNQDGIAQISSILSTQKDIDALHIISHGESGSLQLGTTVINANNLDQYSTQLSQWQASLTENADILLYGCNVASGSLGQSFVTNLSQLTQADIAASENLTGATQLGGDWNLEYATGKIDTRLAIQTPTLLNYEGVLLTPALVDESFKNSTLDTATLNWLYGNGLANPTPSDNLPFLTARTDRTAQTGGIPGVPTGTNPTPIDSDGTGALRLTSVKNASGTSLTNQSGFVIYNTPISSTSGLTILFDYYSYGGTADATTNKGDGLSFFLIDGSKSPIKAGAFGGSLGYAQNRNSGTDGIAGGYVGIGFDEYGNFATEVNSSNNTIRVGGSPLTGDTSIPKKLKLPVPDSITIRGKEIVPVATQDRTTSYPWIATYNTNTLPTGVNGIDGPSTATNRTDTGVERKVGIQLSTNGLLSLFFDTNSNGVGDAGEYVFQNLDIKAANGNIVPANFKFGFAASTGGATNIHEIANLKVLTLGSPPVVDLDYANITVPAGYDYNPHSADRGQISH
ncbi:FG-GAP repeat protein [Planktothrix agardhii CCAP 1459/11A]|uniref:FG-GAP repeat protein n=1 Tax=Planktothrix agardhii CCAP 1459/11A TaxID=282420 RepID=A0A4P5ZHV4_PLAAG|nr:DUF4347 domain-containing protein [Planktothrix agardhii]GDZ95716.1 FG-GAP repeat protein [Planktothrix agardhii CCAP 1459/11A]CAH2574778.1 hypothetical protein PRNO82_04142 [Planktothrix rubescens]